MRRQTNEPLTIGQLRKMDGEPVWTVGVSCTNDGTWAMWDIIEKTDADGIEFGYSTEAREWWSYNLRDSNGKLLDCAWACYRRPALEVTNMNEAKIQAQYNELGRLGEKLLYAITLFESAQAEINRGMEELLETKDALEMAQSAFYIEEEDDDV